MVSFYDAERWERAEKKRNADFARLLAVAVAAKDGYTKGVVQVTHLYGKDFYMVPSETMDSILEALAAVEDLL